VRLEISWAKPAQVRTLQQSILLILVREVVKGKIIASIFAHKSAFWHEFDGYHKANPTINHAFPDLMR
jgi:hypothetical protein